MVRKRGAANFLRTCRSTLEDRVAATPRRGVRGVRGEGLRAAHSSLGESGQPTAAHATAPLSRAKRSCKISGRLDDAISARDLASCDGIKKIKKKLFVEGGSRASRQGASRARKLRRLEKMLNRVLLAATCAQALIAPSTRVRAGVRERDASLQDRLGRGDVAATRPASFARTNRGDDESRESNATSDDVRAAGRRRHVVAARRRRRGVAPASRRGDIASRRRVDIATRRHSGIASRRRRDLAWRRRRAGIAAASRRHRVAASRRHRGLAWRRRRGGIAAASRRHRAAHRVDIAPRRRADITSRRRADIASRRRRGLAWRRRRGGIAAASRRHARPTSRRHARPTSRRHRGLRSGAAAAWRLIAVAAQCARKRSMGRRRSANARRRSARRATTSRSCSWPAAWARA